VYGEWQMSEQVTLGQILKTIQNRPKIKEGFVPQKEDLSYDWATLSIKQEKKLIAFDKWAGEVEGLVLKLQKELEEQAITGENIRFSIDSLHIACDWKAKHNIQDMKFVPLNRVLGVEEEK
jgi:hypothetical protein